jgi:nicotinate-nucleotide adenylyltransferase
MHIGLYFGSFNPIHTGHCIIASHICNHSDVDQLWFVVSPHNPFKASESLLNEYQRLHLVKLAIEGDKRLNASDIEFKLPRPSYTIDTLTYLKEKYPDNRFSVILGSDSFQNLPKWKNGDIIIKEYALFVYPRPGFPIKKINIGQVYPVDAPLLEISSTSVRAFVKARKSIRYLVPDPVCEEIEKSGYYR